MTSQIPLLYRPNNVTLMSFWIRWMGMTRSPFYQTFIFFAFVLVHKILQQLIGIFVIFLLFYWNDNC